MIAACITTGVFGKGAAFWAVVKGSCGRNCLREIDSCCEEPPREGWVAMGTIALETIKCLKLAWVTFSKLGLNCVNEGGTQITMGTVPWGKAKAWLGTSRNAGMSCMVGLVVGEGVLLELAVFAAKLPVLIVAESDSWAGVKTVPALYDKSLNLT